MMKALGFLHWLLLCTKRMIRILPCLVFSLFFAHPSYSQTKHLDDEGMYQALHLARDPELSIEQRMQVAQVGLDYIRARVTAANNFKTVDELLKAMRKDPSINEKILHSRKDDLWKVLTEFNDLTKSLALEPEIKACRKWGDSGLTNQVILGMAGLSHCTEGTCCERNILWIDKNNPKGPPVANSVPSYAYSKNVVDLVNVGNTIMIRTEEGYGKDIFHPTLELARKMNPEFKSDKEAGTVVAAAQLRGEVYVRAIQNEIRNKFTLEMKYRDQSGDANAFLKEMIDQDCAHCTPEMKEKIKIRVSGLYNKDKKEGRVTKRPARKVVEDLCKKLLENRYNFTDFDQTQEGKAWLKGIEKYRGGLTVSGETAGKYNRAVYEYQQAKNEFDNLRKSILTSIVREGGDGLLLLTKTMSQLDNQVPLKVNLGCGQTSERQDHDLPADEALVSPAVSEAINETTAYAKKLNDTIHPGKLDHETINSDLEGLTQIASTQVGEALLSLGHKQLGSYACRIFESIGKRKDAEKNLDNAILWGGMIGGTLLAIGTAGMAAPFVYGGLAVGIAINAGTAVYEWDRAGEAKALSEVYRNAMIGKGGNDTYLLEMTQKEFLAFKEHRLNAILSGVATVADVTMVIVKAAQAGRGIAEINQELKSLEKGGESAFSEHINPGVRQSEVDHLLVELTEFESGSNLAAKTKKPSVIANLEARKTSILNKVEEFGGAENYLQYLKSKGLTQEAAEAERILSKITAAKANKPSPIANTEGGKVSTLKQVEEGNITATTTAKSTASGFIIGPTKPLTLVRGSPHIDIRSYIDHGFHGEIVGGAKLEGGMHGYGPAKEFQRNYFKKTGEVIMMTEPDPNGLIDMYLPRNAVGKQWNQLKKVKINGVTYGVKTILPQGFEHVDMIKAKKYIESLPVKKTKDGQIYKEGRYKGIRFKRYIDTNGDASLFPVRD